MTSDWLSSLSDTPIGDAGKRRDDSSPIFIIGPPRSGSTLLTTMLNAHPRIFMANESKVLVTWLPQAGNFRRPLSEAAAAGILKDLESAELAPYRPLPTVQEIFDSLAVPDLPGLIRELLRQLAHREGKVRWGEKTAVAYRQLEAIRRAFPDGLLIGMVRDPMQIGSSYERMIPKWGALGGLLEWIDYQRTLASQLHELKILLVPYDELTKRPNDTLERVCTYIGEDFSPHMLEFHRTSRANQLQDSPLFAGASRPLYVPAATPAASGSLLRRRLIRGLLRIADEVSPGRTRPPVWESALRVLLFLRAGLWELRQPDAWHRLRRTLRIKLHGWTTRGSTDDR